MKEQFQTLHLEAVEHNSDVYTLLRQLLLLHYLKKKDKMELVNLGLVVQKPSYPNPRLKMKRGLYSPLPSVVQR